MRPKALIAWSSGKDSAWALHEARRSGDYEIVGALTTVTETFGRVSMHGVREELLAAQLDAAGLAPIRVPIPYPCPNEVYEARMAAALADAKARGVTQVIFGDLFLEDVRALSRGEARRHRHRAGVPALAAADRCAGARDDRRRASRPISPASISSSFRSRSPAAGSIMRCSPSCRPSADPCGEKGEFHTFVAAGPMLKRRIPVTVGEVVEREGFAFADIRSARET